MQDDKKRGTDPSNTISRELFVSMDTDEPQTEQMMDAIEEEPSSNNEEPPGRDDE